MRVEFLGGFRTLVALGAISLLSFGCSSTSSCSRPEEDVTIDFSPNMITDGVYYSAPYGGPYQFFPGGRTLHFKHGFGKVPLPPTFWLAFRPEGSAGNPLAQAAGNMAELVGLDADEIVVKNDTCGEELYIWFYAELPH